MIKNSRIFLVSLIILTLCLSIFPYDLDIPTVRGDSDIFQVSHTYNDAFEHGDGTFAHTTFNEEIRTDSTVGSFDYMCAGWMFDTVTIPQGSTILGANISLYVSSASTDDIDAFIFAHDVDDSEDFDDSSYIISDVERPKTTANVVWDEDALGTGWVFSPDITTVIQEIVDRGGWSSGNNLTILIIAEDEETAKYFKTYDYTQSSSYGGKLYVDWEEGASGVYPDHVEDYSLVTNATHTLLDNATYGYFEAGGWIIWDFGSATENVTAINWDIISQTTGSMFRIEGSNDMSSWTILAQPIKHVAGGPPISGSFFSRYDSETHSRYRYYKLYQIQGLGVFWVDSFWLDVQPPAIVYDDGSYVYPTELVYWNWEIWGGYPSSDAYANIPYTTLGKNQTSQLAIIDGTNESTGLVNSDFDEDNYIVVKFDDYYNITLAQVHARSPVSNIHFYLYISEVESGDWTLVGDWSGTQPANWYGASINHTRVRYMMVTCTGVISASMFIESFRIEGTVSVGEGNGEDGYDWNFYLFPNWLADALGIPVLAGQLLASACVLACFLLPFAFYERRSFWATIIVGLVVFAFLVALGWLPTWLMLLLALLIAGLFGLRFSRWFGGK